MSHRIDQLNSLLQQEISQTILKEIDLPIGCLVTVTKVETTKDLEQANIWVSILPENRLAEIEEILEKNIGRVAKIIAKRLFIRKMPHLVLKIDSREIKASHIEELLGQIGQQKKKDNG